MTLMMKAGVASANGLEIRTVPRPSPGPEQVLVQVMAAGINRADLNAAKGAGVASAESLGKPIGMEWAGEVVEVGKDVLDIKIGQRVMCSGSGGYAEFAVADHGRTIPVEGTSLSIEEAATLPLALLTAHDAVVTNGRLASGESILIQGASSAIGLMCLQIARSMDAGLVAATSTNQQRRSALAEFGANLVIDPIEENWPQQLLDATDGKGVNVIIDMVSGKMVNLNMRASSVLGRIVNVGRLGGATTDFDCNLHAQKRLEYIGVTFRTRTLQEVRDITSKMRADLWPAIVSGDIGLPVDREFSLGDGPAAHAYMTANRHFGKIVLKP